MLSYQRWDWPTYAAIFHPPYTYFIVVSKAQNPHFLKKVYFFRGDPVPPTTETIACQASLASLRPQLALRQNCFNFVASLAICRRAICRLFQSVACQSLDTEVALNLTETLPYDFFSVSIREISVSGRSWAPHEGRQTVGGSLLKLD